MQRQCARTDCIQLGEHILTLQESITSSGRIEQLEQCAVAG